MTDGIKAWNEPATKGDLIKIGIRVLGICQSLGAVHTRMLAGETADAYGKMGEFFDKMKAMSDLIDELTGGETA